MCTVPRNVCAIDVRSASLGEWRKVVGDGHGKEWEGLAGRLAEIKKSAGLSDAGSNFLRPSYPLDLRAMST